MRSAKPSVMYFWALPPIACAVRSKFGWATLCIISWISVVKRSQRIVRVSAAGSANGWMNTVPVPASAGQEWIASSMSLRLAGSSA